MRDRQDFERYLLGTNYLVEELGEGTWLVREPSQPEDRLVVRVEAEFVVVRLKVMELAGVEEREALLEQLLRYNVTEVAHGAYGLADDAVVLVSARGLRTLDPEEFEGTVDDFVLAVQNHRSALKALCK